MTADFYQTATECDVLVIGGGTAGSTFSTLMAQKIAYAPIIFQAVRALRDLGIPEIQESSLKTFIEKFSSGNVNLSRQILIGTAFLEFIRQVKLSKHDLVIKSAKGTGGEWTTDCLAAVAPDPKVKTSAGHCVSGISRSQPQPKPMTIMQSK